MEMLELGTNREKKSVALALNQTEADNVGVNAQAQMHDANTELPENLKE